MLLESGYTDLTDNNKWYTHIVNLAAKQGLCRSQKRPLRLLFSPPHDDCSMRHDWAHGSETAKTD